MTNKRDERLREQKLNKQGCLMEIVEYIDSDSIIVEFQDEYNAKVHTKYQMFSIGKVKNPYFPEVFGAGMVGNKYPASINGKSNKEYNTWQSMLRRCFDEKYKNKHTEYKDVTCCEEWLLFENFYEWLHSQENFDKWYGHQKWALDKDILIKGNKVYSPETCCLVPQNVNKLFIKCDAVRGDFPIGVRKSGNKYRVQCKNPFKNKIESLGTYFTIENAFLSYKQYKENIIKQVAEVEYKAGNITRQCYEAMMSYEVEITD